MSKVLLSTSQGTAAAKAEALAKKVADFLGICPDDVLTLPPGVTATVVDCPASSPEPLASPPAPTPTPTPTRAKTTTRHAPEETKELQQRFP